MELGKSIAKIRKENNLTQDDLAEKYYVTRQTISNWENGKSYPDLETLVKLSNDFNIPLDNLLKDNNKMVKDIDHKVKSTKKYKNLLKYIALFICILIFIGYKLIMITKYQIDEENIDTGFIFNETVTINKSKELSDNRLTIDGISFDNYFEDYVDAKSESTYKVKYEDDKVVSFYAVMAHEQYINVLSNESIDCGFDGTSCTLVKTNNNTRKYLDKHDIKNDIDLLNYIKDNYYFKNTIFTLNNKMKVHYLLNSFVNARLMLNYDNISLIDGDLTGYIININSSSGIKEIHLLNNDKQYIILVGGKDVSSNEFINKLLSSITFN